MAQVLDGVGMDVVFSELVVRWQAQHSQERSGKCAG